MRQDCALARGALTKASWRILPLLGLGYLVSYVDRLNVSFAAAQMNLDLGFSATVYGFGAGCFFLTYALLEVPSGLAMPRFGPRRWIARIMISWGLVSAATMFTRTPLEFYLLRLLLGACEAGFWPTAIAYLALWFPGRHRGTAVSRFYCFGNIGSIVMGFLSGWLLGLDGLAGLHGWQWLFLAEGLPTVALGFLFLAFLPDSPSRARWLTAPERAWIASEFQAEDGRHASRTSHHVLNALRDSHVLQLALIGGITIGCSMAFLLIAPQVLAEGTGLDVRHVGYVVSAGGALGVVGMIASGWHSDRLGERFSHLIASCALVALCFVVMATTHSGPILVAGYLAFFLFWPAVTLSTNLVVTEVVPARMVAVAIAAVNTVAQLGAFGAPAIWGISKDATGSYHLGMMLVPLAFLAASAISWNLRRQLRLKAALRPELVPA